eukprot:TRINITY_DN7117_c1_g1_i1.p1 TRINITY_DN7117_c1_g1~~TRINITY_DN7117_c1_g1_i1.p1  ORF type:complete len:441 (+),score=59.27 TRINITY_DN7117_c1_g1_i1:116-1438(+)
MVDHLDVQESEKYGRSAFAAKDLELGEAVLIEDPLLSAPLESEILKSRLKEVQLAGLVETGSNLYPKAVTVQHLGLLDAFQDCSEGIRSEVLALQSEVDSSSPILKSVEKTASFIAGLGGLYNFDEAITQKVLLIGKVNAHSCGENRQGLFPRLRLIAHTCSPNCILTVDPSSKACVRALRRIEQGELLSISYCSEDMLAAPKAQREHYLLCQKGFRCNCETCKDGNDGFGRWPCPACRSRDGSGLLLDEHLRGCCAIPSRTKPPEWESECGKACRAEEVVREEGIQLANEILLGSQSGDFSGGAREDSAAARNAFLAKSLKCLGEEHFATQILLRAGALRSLVAAKEPLASLAERLERCHTYLVRCGRPQGILVFYGTYRAIVARAQAEIRAKTECPTSWVTLVTASALCATACEGEGSQTAARAVVSLSVMQGASTAQ